MTSATDNRTTELLHKLLDERGVKWWEGEDERKTHWVANGLTWEYFNNENGDAWLGFLGACENDVTPDQAIAATLGSEREKALEELVRDLFDRGKYFNPKRYGIKALTKRARNLGIEVNL